MTVDRARDIVILSMAFEWVCLQCGNRQFARGIAPEFDQQTEAVARFFIGETEYENLRRHPANVKCRKCKTRFRAEI